MIWYSNDGPQAKYDDNTASIVFEFFGETRSTTTSSVPTNTDLSNLRENILFTGDTAGWILDKGYTALAAAASASSSSAANSGLATGSAVSTSASASSGLTPSSSSSGGTVATSTRPFSGKATEGRHFDVMKVMHHGAGIASPCIY
jgi:hypothetical protein